MQGYRICSLTLSRGLQRLSITHILRAEQVANFDIGEPGEPSPYDGVTCRSITRTVQVAAKASELRQARVQRWSVAGFSVDRFGDQSFQELDLQRRERQRGLQIASKSIEHRHPEDTPTEDAECRQQVDQALGRP